MKSPLILTIGIGMLIASCSKRENPAPRYQHQSIANMASDGGDDDDRPIWLFVKNRDSIAVHGAIVTLKKDTMVRFVHTNCMGIANVTLPTCGEWDLSIECEGYQDINTSITVSAQDSVWTYFLNP